MNNKYNIDGVEYEYGEEVEVTDQGGTYELKWCKRILVGYVKGANTPFLVVFETDYNDFKNGKEFQVTFYKCIRKIQTTSYEGSSGRFIYGDEPKCKIHYDAQKDLFDAEVSKYFSEIEKHFHPKSEALCAIGTKVFLDAFKNAFKSIKSEILLRGDNTPSLSGRKAKLILDGAEHTVTFE